MMPLPPPPPAGIPILYISSIALLVSALLFALNLGKGFDYRRASTFLKFQVFERFLVATAVVAVVLVSVDFYVALTFPDSIPLFPDVLIRLIAYLGVAALYFEFYRTIGLGKKPKGT